VRFRLFTLLTIGSLLLCLASAVLWVRSYFVDDFVERVHGFGDKLGNDYRWTIVGSVLGSVVIMDCVHVDGTRSQGDTQGAGIEAGVRYGYGWIKPIKRDLSLAAIRIAADPVDRSSEFHALGFALVLRDDRDSEKGLWERNIQIAIPWSAIVLGTGLVSWLCVYRFRKRNRLATAAIKNLCRKCGYSLAGNVSGVCPECGAPARVPTD